MFDSRKMPSPLVQSGQGVVYGMGEWCTNPGDSSCSWAYHSVCDVTVPHWHRVPSTNAPRVRQRPVITITALKHSFRCYR